MIWVGGPYIMNDHHRDLTERDTAVVVYANNIRVTYLYRPQELDLDKLLQLLTPSKDKFERDDDLILDTLFNQRKKAAVLRIDSGLVAARVTDLSQVKTLASLGEDLEKLSRVAKYLPEDDQPGILATIQLQKIDVDISFMDQLGDINTTIYDAEAAYVALPSLTAGKIRSMEVWRNKEHELIGPAIHRAFRGKPTAEDTPMIMARFISEELEPTINLKLYGFRVEYHIPTLLAALGMDPGETAEQMAAEMTKSVLDFAKSDSKADVKKFEESDTGLAPGVPRRLSVALRDCHVGLGCRRSPARGLFVISSGHFLGEAKDGLSMEALLDLKKASLMIIDDKENVGIRSSSTRNRNVTGDTHIQRLCDLGYVSVSTISSAILTVKAVSTDETEERSMDIEVRDNLLILETCADSTQTLITILNGLSLPTPSVQDQKYRTEVVPIQEMLQSLAAESFSHFTEERENVSPDSALENLVITDEGDYVSDFSPVLPDTDTGIAKRRQQQPTQPGESGMLLGGVEPAASAASSISSLDFQEGHFAQQFSVGGTAHRWNSTNNTYSFVNDSKLRSSPLRVRVRDVHVIWNLFDGYDWKRTRDEISKAVQRVQADATERGRRGDGQSGDGDDDEASIVGDFLFNSIYIDIPSNRDPQTLPDMINHDINDLASETTSHNTSTTITAHYRPKSRSLQNKPLRLARSKRHKITFELKGICADLVVFPAGLDETQSSLDIRVGDLEIFDHLTTSTWKKFATYMRDAGERETGASMIHLEILNVKPVPDLAASEIVLKATVLPLRLHVDQDALDFLTRFFAFKDDTVQPEVLPTEQPFIQRAEINSIPVKLDFKPKRVDYGGLRSGRTTEFMNFFVLDEANMVLRHCIIYGISGFEKLGQTLNDIWMPDVKANQLPGVLAGLAPIKPLVGVGSGFRNLILVPVKEYKKDGRVVRSLQKGAVSFAKTTTNELVKLGAKLAIGTQTVLQSAESFFNAPNAGGSALEAEPVPVNGLWEDVSIDENEKAHISLYADQPIGVKQGVKGGYASLGRDLTMARDAIVAVPGEITESGSASQAAKAIFKRAPTIILRPAIGASKAVGQTLLGVGNSLDPTQRRRNEDKYKHH
ncbi:Autophagy-related protein [Ascosphaera apis ARSEF 7405]|uniref:Autophagy-related protein 2 n=1 Tax=Ascosphaera apis ARSEF 7405 TaxID=392613 RepID=A0A167Z725_9EURO|nr:Autophagy-related protein [Ascosphaera apis ARSEF 7405]